MSERRSALSPEACSGDMYSILPLRPPGIVSVIRPSALATPKSMTLTAPSNDTRMFCGEMSRWTMFRGHPGGVRQGMGVTETIRRLPNDECRLRVPEWPLGAHCPAQDGGQWLALHRLHREEVVVAVPADLDNSHDIRVVEQRPDTRLIEEHPNELILRGQVGQDPLDDHQGPKGGQLA